MNSILKPLAFESSFTGWPIEEVLQRKASLLEGIQSKPVRPETGTLLTTCGGIPYLFGPDYHDLWDQWHLFVASTHRKNTVLIFTYGHRTEYSGYGTKRIRTHTLRPPMSKAHMMWLYHRLASRDRNSTAFFFSSRLLLDFLAMADAEGIDVQHDTVFTFSELVPKSAEQRIKFSFPSWCHSMRSWRGGLAYWTCGFGTLHTCDDAMHCKNSKSGEFLVTDFLNEAESFIDFPSGDYGNISDTPQLCPCGHWHFDMKHEACGSSHIINQGGDCVVPFPDRQSLPVGWQILQLKIGKLLLLRPDGWTRDQMGEANEMIDGKTGNCKIEFARGWVRKRTRMPACTSLLVTNKNFISWHADRTYSVKTYLVLHGDDSDQSIPESA